MTSISGPGNNTTTGVIKDLLEQRQAGNIAHQIILDECINPELTEIKLPKGKSIFGYQPKPDDTDSCKKAIKAYNHTEGVIDHYLSPQLQEVIKTSPPRFY